MPSRSAVVDAIDPSQLRRAFGLYATGVTIITAEHPTRGKVGVTANSFASVSLEPPLLLFSLARTAFSLQPLLESPGFVVNVLRAGQRALSHRFAHSAGDKWAGLSWRPASNGAPILAGVIASFECVHHGQHDGGDHLICVGRVVGMDNDPEGEPLLYFHSRYRAMGAEIESDP